MNAISRINLLAQTCLEDTKGDQRKAQAKMKKSVLADKELYEQLTMPAVDKLVWQVIRDISRAIRKETLGENGGAHQGNGNRAGIEAMASKTARSLLEMPLSYSSGKRLGESNRKELLGAADKHDAHGLTHLRQAKYYRAIAAKLVKNQKVREQFSHGQLQELLHKIEEEAA